MQCTGAGCERKMQCARYYLVAPPDGKVHTLESLYSFGSGAIGSDGTVKDEWWCSPLGNWGMFVPLEQTNADRIRAMSDEELAEFLEGDYGNMMPGTALKWLRQPAKEEK